MSDKIDLVNISPARRYYLLNREKRKDYALSYYYAHKEEILERLKQKRIAAQADKAKEENELV